MTPKQRVMAAVNHEEPDRVPLDVGASAVTSIHYMAYNDLVSHLGLNDLVRGRNRVKFMDLVQGVVQVDEAFARKFSVDAKGFVPGSYDAKWDDRVSGKKDEWIIKDSFGGTWSCPKSGFYFDQRPGSFPMAEFTSVSDVENFEWPELISQKELDDLPGVLRSLDPHYALLLGEPIGGIFNTCFKLRGYNTFFLDLAINPGLAGCLMEKITQIKIKYWESVLERAGDLIDILVLEDDLGHQNTTMISPDMYRTLIKPHHQRLISRLKKISPDNIKIMLHSCGSVYHFIPDLIEVGIDILNPVQTTAAHMNTATLKKEFGADLVFWGGGVDIQNVLPFGSPAQVGDEVKKRMDDLAPGGGFVFAATHNIQPKTPPENIVKMWEAFQDNCAY
ncbi:MAG: hypothetical protein MI802_19745 [Desulfobacterales bacterium]|nr:hypothetical protein [Desulfobacterales bacterium]